MIGKHTSTTKLYILDLEFFFKYSILHCVSMGLKKITMFLGTSLPNPSGRLRYFPLCRTTSYAISLLKQRQWISITLPHTRSSSRILSPNASTPSRPSRFPSPNTLTVASQHICCLLFQDLTSHCSKIASTPTDPIVLQTTQRELSKISFTQLPLT